MLFSASSGWELADQAAKLAARAQRKARKKVDEIGIDMPKIRKTAGMEGQVNDFMQTVNNIPSLSYGNKPPGKASRNSKETQSQDRSDHACDSSAGDGLAGAVCTDNSALAAIIAQQQSMMASQMKMFMDFQQQLQMQSLFRNFHPTTVKPNLVQRSSPSSTEKRAERSAHEKLELERRQAKIESIKAKKKKCDE